MGIDKIEAKRKNDDMVLRIGQKDSGELEAELSYKSLR